MIQFLYGVVNKLFGLFEVYGHAVRPELFVYEPGLDYPVMPVQMLALPVVIVKIVRGAEVGLYLYFVHAFYTFFFGYFSFSSKYDWGYFSTF